MNDAICGEQRLALRTPAWRLRLLRRHLLAGAWGATLGVCSSAGAAEAGPPTAELPAVTVRAEKLVQALEKVPASLTVLEGLESERAGFSSLAQLEGRVPGLSFQPFGQAGLNAPVMRGLTANFSSFSTAALLLVDGVPMLTAQGFEYDFLDLDRIEVLRGPQSTLYGRNAEAGVIAVHSLPMDGAPRASMSAEAGSRNKRWLRFSLGRALVPDTLAASIAGGWSGQQGFIDNLYTGRREDEREQLHLNLGLRWTPTAATELVLRYTRQQYDDGAALWGSPASSRAQVASGTPSWNRSRGQTFSLNATQGLAAGLRLQAITAYSALLDRVQQDTDFRPADLLHIGRDHHLRNLSQELRLEGRLGTADWLAGIYADRQDDALHNLAKSPMGASDLRVARQGNTFALFTNWNQPLSSAWSLSAGARVERNTVEILPEGDARRQAGWTQVSPRLALQSRFARDQQWYLSASRGVRAGGFNVLSPAVHYLPYEPEKVWSYEMGIKGRAADRRLRHSLAAYLMEVRDMQVMQMPAPGLAYITSAAAARSKGLELELDYLPDGGWQIKSGLSWNHTRFERFRDAAADYAGKHNPFAPDWSGHIGLRYEAPSGWYAQAGLVGMGKVYLDAANRYARQGHGLLNLLGGYARGAWEFAAYANNSANKRYDAVGYQNGFVTVFSPPRELGARLSWRQ